LGLAAEHLDDVAVLRRAQHQALERHDRAASRGYRAVHLTERPHTDPRRELVRPEGLMARHERLPCNLGAARATRSARSRDDQGVSSLAGAASPPGFLK